MTGQRLQILIADDHAIIRLGLRQALSLDVSADYTEAKDAREALEYARAKPFDLILLDITMPGRSGLDTIADLKLAQPKTPILVVSMHAEEQYAVRVLRAGASGYITKSQLASELVTAVQKILTGRTYVSEAVADRLVANIGLPGTAVGHDSLSAREFEVLRMIAAGRSGKEIAADLNISFKTVSTYRTRILQKLNLQTNHQLTEYARHHGLTEESDLGP